MILDGDMLQNIWGWPASAESAPEPGSVESGSKKK